MHYVWTVCFNSVTMKSPDVSLTLSALFTLENFPGHKLDCQQLKCRAVLRELNYKENLFALFFVSLLG